MVQTIEFTGIVSERRMGLCNHILTNIVSLFLFLVSFVGGTVNIPTQLQGPDGQSVTCKDTNCPTNQAFHGPDDYQATRNSALGGTYNHIFCP
jgi:hypothetical protein